MMQKQLRSGVTLIEVIVVILIVGVLALLLFLAIIGARANSRNLSCQNNLRQIGLGICNYESTHRFFPPACDANGFSLHVNLLPMLGQEKTYIHYGMFRYSEDARLISNFSKLPKSHGLAAYRCPDSAILPYLNLGVKTNSDSLPSPKLGEFELDFTSYLACFGSRTALPDIEYSGLCIMMPLRPRARAAEVRNGLSQTLAVSEGAGFDLASLRQYREPEGSKFAKGLIYMTSHFYADADALAQDCMNGSGTSPFTSVVGYGWITADTDNCFTTWLPPNSRSCLNRRGPKRSPISPSSHHGDQVNACFGDGSVRVIHNDIELTIWQRMGQLSDR